MITASRVDLYQLTSLVPHHAAGLSDAPVAMCFFSRRLPREPISHKPARGYLLWAGLQRCLDYLEQAAFTEEALDGLQRHPTLGPALRAHPDLVERLARWRFSGEVHAPREGTPLLAGPAVRRDGSPVDVDGVRPAAYCPYLVVETDLLSAKLIETPLLSIINTMTMVATKASQIVRAAKGRAVLEFGTRRVHLEEAIDSAVAAYIGGCTATSNVEAGLRHGIPVAGTMDHFAIQAWERPGVPRHETERAFFEAFHALYPGADTLLVDTYDTFGERTGIRNAVAATGGTAAGIRIDSAVTRDNIWRARRLLDRLGARGTRIVVSGGLDERAIAALGDAPVDGYGVGERIVTSPDAPVGVGAVGKLTMVNGRPSMKLSRGSGKATLPGLVQCWRTEHGDVVGLRGETVAGEPLLSPVWTRDGGRLPAPPLAEVREYAAHALAALPAEAHAPRQVQLPVTDRMAALIEQLVRACG